MNETIILCVDDEEIVLRSLKRELNDTLGEEYVIETAEDGEDALELFTELLQDGYEVPLIISDHIMPNMKGDELLRRVHTIAPRTLKIMLTGQADLEAVTNAVNRANLYRYVAKPWEKTDFSLTVKEAIHKYFQDKKLEEQHETLQKLYTQAQQEIAERKRVEEALRESEASIRAIVETAADGIITFDEQGMIISFNSAAEWIFGYGVEEIIGQNITTLMPSSFHAEYDRYQRGSQEADLERIICIGHEVTGRRKNGSTFPLDFTVSEVHMGKQQIFTGIVRDITERKRSEQERLQLSTLQHELTIARDIQQSLLPKPKPDWTDVDVICYSHPAHEVGGDFYSYHAFVPFSISPANSPDGKNGSRRRFALAIGDVSGKGISAALLMASSLSQFDASLSLNFTPVERLAYLDKAILQYTKSHYQNCALCYVEFDLIDIDSQSVKHDQAALTLRAVNAGGIPPYIKRTDGSVEWLDIRGLPLGLGIGADLGYQEVSVNLSRGDMVILASDGVAEANTIDDEMFGFEQLETAIAAAPTISAQAVLDHLKTELAAFVGKAEPYDDVTIIVAQV